MERWSLTVEGLAKNSPEAQNMFMEIMRIAEEEYEFRALGAQLVVEATPARSDGFVLIVTRIADGDAPRIPPIRTRREPKIRKAGRTVGLPLIFEFDSLDYCIAAAKELYDFAECNASLYKYNDLFYLLITGVRPSNIEFIDNILVEYGRTATGGNIFEGHLIEYGKTLIKNNAIYLLANEL